VTRADPMLAKILLGALVAVTVLVVGAFALLLVVGVAAVLIPWMLADPFWGVACLVVGGLLLWEWFY